MNKLDKWDRYDNPFEQKYTLRDKFNFPPLLTQLFETLTNDIFIKHQGTKKHLSREKLSNLNSDKIN